MPVITIDGPASSGKGTVARQIAGKLGFNYLDSGAIYRSLGLAMIKSNVDLTNTKQIIELIERINLRFLDKKIILNGHDETNSIRAENVGMVASAVAAIPEVRVKLLDFQRSFNREPGLVTDGRDMGSVVFPDAELKVFLTATAEKRALRRYSQLQENSISGTIESILRDIEIRDKQDRERNAAPLSYDDTFRVLDNSDLTIDETVHTILNWYTEAISLPRKQ